MTIGSIGGSGSFDPSQVAAKFFKKADTNGDGGIDKGELTSVLANRPGGSRGAANVDKIFASVDANGDGKIDASENEAALKKTASRAGGGHPGGASPAGARPVGDGGQAGQSSAKAFDPADTNQDGTVSAAEERAFDAKNTSAYDQAGKQTSTGNATGSLLDTSA